MNKKLLLGLGILVLILAAIYFTQGASHSQPTGVSNRTALPPTCQGSEQDHCGPSNLPLEEDKD